MSMLYLASSSTYFCFTHSSLFFAVAYYQGGETIRQAAERTAQQIIRKTATWKGQPDDVAQLHFVGNCPAGWFWRTGDEEQQVQSRSFGDKVNIASSDQRLKKYGFGNAALLGSVDVPTARIAVT